VPSEVHFRITLAERLRAQTSDLHALTERSGIMPALLRGQLERPVYCALLRNLHAIYAALEPALARHAADPVVGPVVFPPLFREDALAADLCELQGDRWADEIRLEPAAAQYVRRLHAIEISAPALLVAHAYVRSLGDLSGGQLLRGIVSRSLSLDEGRGTRFYAFGSAAEVLAHRVAFRAGLAALPVDEELAAGIVAEARSAFERHVQLFAQLAPARRATIGAHPGR
jgi:heme oxygenase